jgi:heat shock protein HspQ
MESSIIIPRAKFEIGQTIRHSLFNYRGVIVDIDSRYSEDDDWYEKLGTMKPRKDMPWYRVLVHDTAAIAYIPEQHLRNDESNEEIEHPAIQLVFDAYKNGRYHRPVRLQ